MKKNRKIKDIVHLSTRYPMTCKFCGGLVDFDNFKIDELVNHYLNKHEYELLHVGQGTYTNIDDVLIHSTEFVVGK